MSPHLILFLAANPSSTSRLALDQECAAIERELRMAANRDFEFVTRWAVTVDEMMRHLNELRPTIIHFSGHGIDADAAPVGSSMAYRDGVALRGGSGIYLEGDRGEAQLVSASALTMMIKSAAETTRIVVLNSCYSGAQADAVCSVVDCVVGMDGAIDDDAARSFAVGFYRALANRRSVRNAVEQAVATLVVYPVLEPVTQSALSPDADRVSDEMMMGRDRRYRKRRQRGAFTAESVGSGEQPLRVNSVGCHRGARPRPAYHTATISTRCVLRA